MKRGLLGVMLVLGLLSVLGLGDVFAGAREAAVAESLAAHGAAFDVYADCVTFVEEGAAWEDPGVESAWDVHDGELKGLVTVEYVDGPVDTSVAWSIWHLVYRVSDASGNAAEARRVVVVEGLPDTDPPVIVLAGCD